MRSFSPNQSTENILGIEH